MTTAELKAKVEANGLDDTIDKYYCEPSDDQELAALWEKAYEAKDKYDQLAKAIEDRLGI